MTVAKQSLELKSESAVYLFQFRVKLHLLKHVHHLSVDSSHLVASVYVVCDDGSWFIIIVTKFLMHLAAFYLRENLSLFCFHTCMLPYLYLLLLEWRGESCTGITPRTARRRQGPTMGSCCTAPSSDMVTHMAAKVLTTVLHLSGLRAMLLPCPSMFKVPAKIAMQGTHTLLEGVIWGPKHGYSKMWKFGWPSWHF